MSNLFDSPLSIHEQYDLKVINGVDHSRQKSNHEYKGSTVGRHVDNEELNPDIARKDNDFTR